MKKILLICTLIGGIIALSACSKESEFKSAINQSLENKYTCLNLNTSLFVAYMDDKELRQYNKENTVVVIQTKNNGVIQKDPTDFGPDSYTKAEALVKAGLLTKTAKTEQASILKETPLKGISFVINLYNLTDKGKQTVKKNPLSSPLDPANFNFCYTHPKVDNILNYLERDSAGQKVAEIKYSYKYVDIASWINTAEIKSAFPEIDKTLNNPDKSDIILLFKTNNGWKNIL
ncbi:MAG: putative secreted protein [Burkholderiales bacterium]|jgi:phage terminase large subunit-like protein|nr:putative secreted protein [Burkholderiales bacterium]